MNPPALRTLLPALLAAILLPLAGCTVTAVSAASVASIAAATATTAEKGFGAWAGSKFTYVDEADLTDMRWATESAIDRLQLNISKQSFDEKKATYRWKVRDADNDHLAKIKLKPLTPRMMVVTIDVGLFGNKPAGTLLASRIRDKLNQIKHAEGEEITNAPPSLQN
ncbi:DUF3568 domain-containing protein [Mucisphaera calidilacus]|uniref:DUF3568 family protein n=1 Tax=Mucisphaera calidilacus TaxID=2527982 RepID=A0A518BZ44_9BACT|nr:DUF3568 domain-containing protein [Mucisphaera calidilacus]QDU72240.1 hypothetical protein Pan265_21040 [Mucisphaera calidilacus]